MSPLVETLVYSVSILNTIKEISDIWKKIIASEFMINDSDSSSSSYFSLIDKY